MGYIIKIAHLKGFVKQKEKLLFQNVTLSSLIVFPV